MRPLMLIGVVLIVVGGYLFYNGGTFSTRKQVLEVGSVKVTAREEHQAPKWIAAVVAVVGLGLVVGGAARGGRS